MLSNHDRNLITTDPPPSRPASRRSPRSPSARTRLANAFARLIARSQSARALSAAPLTYLSRTYLSPRRHYHQRRRLTLRLLVQLLVGRRGVRQRERASRTPSPGRLRAHSLAIPARSSIGLATASTSAQRAPGPPSPPRHAPCQSPRRLPARKRLANASHARSLAIRASLSISLAAAGHPASTSSASRLASRLALRSA